MAYRYECSACKGTFDVPEQTFPPSCPLTGHKKGAMKLIGGALHALIPATGCEDGNAEQRALATFLNRRFLIPRFVPATGRGSIDCSYLPAQGRIDISLLVYCNFKTSSYFSSWSEQEKLDYKKAAQKAVDDHWNGKAALVCNKPRWGEVPPAVIRYGIRFSDDPNRANYKLDIMKEAQPYELNGLGEKTLKCSAYIDMLQVIKANPSAQITGQLQSFQTETLNLLAAAKSIGRDERLRLEKAIKDTGAGTIPFDKNKATPTEAGRLALTNFAWKARTGRVEKSPLVPIRVVGSAAQDETDPPGLAAARAKAVDIILGKFNVPHPRQQSAGPALIAGSAGKAEVSMDRDFEDDMQNYDQANYNIFAHEFGHMCGLPDEYLDEIGDPLKNPKVVMQAGLLSLAEKARVSPPVFGKATKSIMSYGEELLTCHFLPVWQAMTEMTREFVEPNSWKIQLLG